MELFTCPLLCDAGKQKSSDNEQRSEKEEDEASLESRQLLPLLQTHRQERTYGTERTKREKNTYCTLLQQNTAISTRYNKDPAERPFISGPSFKMKPGGNLGSNC